MTTNAKASANTKAIIIAVNIFGAADGLRPSEIILAKALAAKTAHGPIIHKVNITVRAIFRSILLPKYSTRFRSMLYRRNVGI